MCLLHRIAGAFRYQPSDIDRLSSKSADLIKRATEDIDTSKLIDFHAHVAGINSSGSNTFVNAKMQSWRYPFHRLKFELYKNACAIRHESNADTEMVGRLIDLVKYFPNHGKHRILAFDKNYRLDGTVDLSKTEFYVPNEYVFEIAAANPELFEPVMSVHPYRSDALQELEKWSARGARIVKWLPNAMGIDPSNSKCDAFYSKMKELRLILLSHGGEEKAVEAEEDQKHGNPLLLRRALDHGVKVIVAHCAGLGTNSDLDDPQLPKRSNFELFLRLMNEKKYEGLLFADISAMTQYNRCEAPLATILQRGDLHDRLVNGSDYPLPAFNILVRTRDLVRHGYISAEQRIALNEIYDYNVLLFDFVLKRSLVTPGTSNRLAAAIFTRDL
jgi:uncharacterized protein